MMSVGRFKIPPVLLYPRDIVFVCKDRGDGTRRITDDAIARRLAALVAGECHLCAAERHDRITNVDVVIVRR